MYDYILKVTIARGGAFAHIATTRDTVNEAVRIHNTTPVVSAALGRLLTASAMMGLQLKSEDAIITLSIKGDGPIQGIVVTGDSNGNVKGYPFNPYVELELNKKGKLDVAGAVGKGTLNVIKDLGLKEPYAGSIPLVSGEIGEDLTYYYSVSEQTPSSVGLGVLVDVDYSIKAAGGFIVQMLPGSDDELADVLTEKISSMGGISDYFSRGKTPYDMAEDLFGDLGYEIKEEIPVEYKCNCNRRRVEKALISLGRTEIEKILDEDKTATLHCHFCNKDYEFNEDELRELIDGIKAS